MPFLAYREESKKNYGTTVESVNASITSDQLKIGAMLRIADAVEIVSKNYSRLLSENEELKKEIKYQRDERHAALRRISSLRGVITRLKKR